ncbi:hypothetical protein CC86DRAFT_12305 [Ophiobolus disseminans]|uniref:Uncharacterized protein n=1 Tax=Ophiobolus disseminans TaxID=1469910 RepID=A0A6A7AJZ7_9PLEO|nr:hypothetical protein CC86DRAFT_12305 [Ophiobolus disseminans]
MKTANGYAIYKHIYQTTQPSTWQSLVAKHSRTTNPTATTSPTRPRTPSSASSSSFDRARHATGKIARFILAVPSDPAYKTHSNRAPDINPRQFAAAMPWLNPMAVEAFAGADTWIPQNKRDKGKGREVARLGAEGVEEMDFAPATAAAAHVPPTSPERTLDAPPALPRESEVSGGSAWPESDSQGNWYDAGKARLRGGGLVRRRTGAKGKGKKVLELGAEKEGLM